MTIASRSCRLALLACLGLCLALGARGQDGEAPSLQDSIEALQEAVAADEGLEEAVRTELQALYGQAASQLRAAREYAARAAAFQKDIDEAPNRITLLQQELADTPGRRVRSGPPLAGMTAFELQQEISQLQVMISDARARATGIGELETRYAARLAGIREQLTAARGRLEELGTAATPADAAPREAEALDLLRRARTRAREAEIRMLELEQLSADVRRQVEQLQGELARKQLPRLETQLAEAQGVLTENFTSEALNLALAIEVEAREILEATPRLEEQAQRNVDYSNEYARETNRLRAVSGDAATVAESRERMERDFRNVRQRIELVGMNRTLSELLRNERRRLPNTAQYARELKRQRQGIALITLRQLELSDALEDFQAPGTAASDALLVLDPPATDAEEGNLRVLLESRREVLSRLTEVYGRQARALADLDFEKAQLLAVAVEFEEFIDQYMLWLPDVAAIDFKVLDGRNLKQLAEGTVWLLSPTHWLEVFAEFRGRGLAGPLLTLLAGLPALLLLAFRRDLKDLLRRLLERGRSIRTDRLRDTLLAAGVCVLLALPLPLLFLGLAWRLELATQASDFVASTAAAAWRLAEVTAPILLLTAFTRRGGLAERHLQWRSEDARLLYRELLAWLPLAAPALALFAATRAADLEPAYAGLGRLAFMIAMFVTARTAWVLLNPQRGLPATTLNEAPQGWLSRLRLLWYGAAVAAPVVLMLLAAVGFLHTAQSLAKQCADTVVVAIVVILTRQLLLRWITLERRRLEFESRVKRLQDARAAAAVTEAAAPEEAVPTPEEPPVDFKAIDTQTRHVINVISGVVLFLGAWAVWAPTLPALDLLKEVELWRYAIALDGEEVTQVVSLQTLLVVLLLAALVNVAARNLPGVLEILVLQRLPLDNGSRYAITTMSQYTIAAGGILLIFGMLGLQWSKIQWLVAALSVGLGFGLQEIVANFVSGVIILFERPIRVGDTVTIGQLSGTVSRIRIRATTIVDWDNKEIIVPNKTFITSQLTNWTLTDPVTRIVIPIGLAYGSDVGRAGSVIMAAATAVDGVLDMPPPRLFFRNLGDSSLNFELFVYVDVLKNRLPVTDAVLTAVTKALSAAGFTIPFPQRDLHVHWPRDEPVPVPLGEVRG